MMVVDLSGNGFGTRATGQAHDWTEGTGVIPASGLITIPAPPNGAARKWLIFQNQSAVSLSIGTASVNANGVATTTNTISIPAGGSIVYNGGGSGSGPFMPHGAVIISGVAGSALTVLEELG